MTEEVFFSLIFPARIRIDSIFHWYLGSISPRDAALPDSLDSWALRNSAARNRWRRSLQDLACRSWWTIGPSIQWNMMCKENRFPYIWCKTCKNSFFHGKRIKCFFPSIWLLKAHECEFLHLLLKTHSRLVAMGQDGSKKLRLNQISSGSSIEQHPCRPSYNFHAARNSWKLLENLIYLRPLS